MLLERGKSSQILRRSMLTLTLGRHRTWLQLVQLLKILLFLLNLSQKYAYKMMFLVAFPWHKYFKC